MGLGPSAPGGHTKLLRATRKQRDILSQPAGHSHIQQRWQDTQHRDMEGLGRERAERDERGWSELKEDKQ